MSTKAVMPLQLRPDHRLGRLGEEDAPAPIEGANWYAGREAGDGLAYAFPAGALATARFLSADMLLDGNHLTVFALDLQEGENGPAFHFHFGLLNQCGARLRIPLELVNQNRWSIPREGAWLKQICAGDRVTLENVDRMTLTVFRKSENPVRVCVTPFTASVEEPERIQSLTLPQGPLLDELGQSTLHEWSAKTRSAEEMIERLEAQQERAPSQQWPAQFSPWGGWTGDRWEATGYFRSHNDGRRWWLVDPDGFPFWSAGMDCVTPTIESAYGGLESALTWLPDPDDPSRGAVRRGTDQPTVDYLISNFVRAFGLDAWRERWETHALAQLRQFGFNTVGNWSDWRMAARSRFPYVRPLSLAFPKTPLIYRDFPDVYDGRFTEDAAAFAQQLGETADDPAMIGYFLGNEPTWGFASEPPAAGMLFVTASCATRVAFREFLQQRYEDDPAFAQAWDMPVTLANVTNGQWTTPLTPAALRDCEAFSEVMVARLFDGLSDACRAVDPQHLNLGARYHTAPPDWAISGMRSFDVFSVNCYRDQVPDAAFAPISAKLNRPILIGEWHFGALDVGLPASGIGRVQDQDARGQAFRVYAEDAAARPWCIGVHYFTLYDQSALGRFDGENYNIGFLDVCNRPYEPLARAARTTHERLYEVVQGQVEPYQDAPEYLPRLFS